MYARSDESFEASTLNIEWAVNYWLSNGTPKDKLILGVPLYGRSFTLAESSYHDIGAPVKGAGYAGDVSEHISQVMYN